MSDSRRRILLQLCEPAQRAKVVRSFQRIVSETFHEDARRAKKARGERVTATENEIRRRADITYNWFTSMRGDLGFSLSRTLDLLPTALRSELDGIPWAPPPPDRMWAGGVK